MTEQSDRDHGDRSSRMPSRTEPLNTTPPGAAVPTTPTATSTRLGDRWWWSPTLATVLGVVVVAYQWRSITSPDPLWLNWVVAALGLAAAVHGAVRLVRAYRSL